MRKVSADHHRTTGGFNHTLLDRVAFCGSAVPARRELFLQLLAATWASPGAGDFSVRQFPKILQHHRGPRKISVLGNPELRIEFRARQRHGVISDLAGDALFHEHSPDHVEIFNSRAKQKLHVIRGGLAL